MSTISVFVSFFMTFIYIYFLWLLYPFPIYIARYGYVLKVTCFRVLDFRTRLNGMLIHGGLTKDGVFTRLYQDASNAESCSVYRDYGDSVCDDVILFPITSQQKVRFLKISAKWVTVCEVQVFAGKWIACKNNHNNNKL